MEKNRQMHSAKSKNFLFRILYWMRGNIVTIAMLGILLGFYFYQKIPLYKLQSSMTDRPAASFSIKDLKGQEHSLSELRGKYVLLNFWATWCMPCRLEIPALRAAYKELGGENFAMLAITSEDPSVVRKFIQNNPVNYPILLDTGGAVHALYRVAVFPTLVFVDEKGIVSDVGHGFDPLLKWRLRFRTTGKLF